MFKYILKRTVLAFLTAFLIISITFLLLKTLPFTKPEGDNSVKYTYYQDQVQSGFVIDFAEEEPSYGELLWSYKDGTGKMHYYYEIPAFQQYFTWLGNVLQGDWGTSSAVKVNVNVQYIIAERIGVSIILNFWSSLIAIPAGIALGVFAALRKNTKTDHAISTGVMVFRSIPGFVLITLFMLVFAYNLKWVPTQFPIASAPLGTRLLGYVLPITVMALSSISGYARSVRAELCEVMTSDYLLLARTKGLTKSQAINKHALKNSLIPIFPSILGEVLFIFSGSMILEKLYGINGMGTIFISALNLKDYNVMLVWMAIFTTFGLLAGILLDISYKFIDPRYKVGGKK